MISEGLKTTVREATATKKIKVWCCGVCKHTVPITPDLEGLDFQWYSNFTSKLTCPTCGSYTIQRSYDNSFTHGEFLIVRSKRKIIPKGMIK